MGAGAPLAHGINFAAGLAGSMAEQKIARGHVSPARAVVDGILNAFGNKVHGTRPLKHAKDAFIRGAREGAVCGAGYNIADVLDNKLRNAHRKRQKAGRNPSTHPSISRSPQQSCEKQRPLNGMQYPNKGGSIPSGDDKFRLGDFLWDTISGAILGGLAGVAFYGVDKGIDALKRSVLQRYIPVQNKRIVRGKKPLIEYDLQFFAKKHPAEYYFRGTSEGFAGNNALIRLGITPTSTDPLISTVFALRSEQYGKGVLYIAFKNNLKNIEIGSSNYFENYEKEVCFNILPLDFAKRVHMSIAAKDAKQILAKTGYNLSGNIALGDVSTYLKSLPSLNSQEIKMFVNMAKEIMK